jgi:hypothetical protein
VDDPHGPLSPRRLGEGPIPTKGPLLVLTSPLPAGTPGAIALGGTTIVTAMGLLAMEWRGRSPR